MQSTWLITCKFFQSCMGFLGLGCTSNYPQGLGIRDLNMNSGFAMYKLYGFSQKSLNLYESYFLISKIGKMKNIQATALLSKSE